MHNEHIRAISWWLQWKDLEWPRPEVKEQIKIRAAQAAAANVNTVILFGAHFRWDFLPMWERLHDLINFIGTELHRYDIRFFDHHSSTLTHRYYGNDSESGILCNRHHLQFYPSISAATEWRVNGKYLNDWRMIDVKTQKPLYLHKYAAEQFCFNHPVFVEEYLNYIKKLLAETNIDGLMCDDALHFSLFNSCSCTHCLEKFGEPLPDIDNFDFWHNRHNPSFRRWIAMRYDSVRSFYDRVAAILPPNFAFLHCCGASHSVVASWTANTYEDYLDSADIIAFEMGPNLPFMNGTISSLLPGQFFNEQLAARHKKQALGLGYGFSEATAEFIWAYNKFSGVGNWFSTLKLRLRLPDSDIEMMPNEPELIAKVYDFEKQHPELFIGTSTADVAIVYSRATRDFHGGWDVDYTADVNRLCQKLLQDGIMFDLLPDISMINKYKILLLPSMVCISSDDRNSLCRFIQNGGRIFATGPLGLYDGNIELNPWFPMISFLENKRKAIQFIQNMYEELTPEIICTNSPQWIELPGGFQWHPDRSANPPLSPVPKPDGFFRRSYQNKFGDIITHYIAEEYFIEVDEALEKRRPVNLAGTAENKIIIKINKRNCASMGFFPTCSVFFPIDSSEEYIHNKGELQLPDNVYYFITKETYHV